MTTQQQTMTTMHPPFQLEGTALEKLEITRLHDFKPKEASNMNIQLGSSAKIVPVQLDDNETAIKGVRVDLVVKSNIDKSINPPCSFHVQLAGLFKPVDGHQIDEKFRDLLLTQGGSVLYGQIRELLLLVTGRMPQGGVMLPLISPGALTQNISDAGEPPSDHD